MSHIKSTSFLSTPRMQVLLECTELGVQGPLTWQPHNIKTVIKGVGDVTTSVSSSGVFLDIPLWHPCGVECSGYSKSRCSWPACCVLLVYPVLCWPSRSPQLRCWFHIDNFMMSKSYAGFWRLLQFTCFKVFALMQNRNLSLESILNIMALK